MSGARKFLLAALAAGIAMRVVLLWLAALDPNLLTHSDQLMYINLAEHLRQGGGFGVGFGVERLPAYPMFLAFCFNIADVLGLAAHKLVVAAAVQNILGLLVIPVMYLMGRMFSRGTAELAAGFAALNLNMIVYGTQMFTEALFFPLFALGLLVMFDYKRRGGAKRIAAAALIFGFCTLVRPVTIYLPLFIIPYLLVERTAPRLSWRLGNAALFIVLFAAAVSPWMIRNCSLYGRATLTGQGVPHIVGWVLPSVSRYDKGMDLTQAMDDETRLWAEYEKGLPQEVRENPLALSKEAESYGMKRLLRSSPFSIAKAWFWGAVKNLFTPVAVELAYILDMKWSHFSETPGKGFVEQSFNFLFHNENKVYSLMLAGGIVLTLAFRLAQLFGALICVRTRPGIFILGLVVTAYFLLVSGPVGYAKYRLPYEPLFILFTALAVGRWTGGRDAGPGGRA